MTTWNETYEERSKNVKDILSYQSIDNERIDCYRKGFLSGKSLSEIVVNTECITKQPDQPSL